MGGVAKDDEKLNRSLCQPGAKVFYWEAEHAWALGIVEKDDGKKFTVKGVDCSCTKTAELRTEVVGEDKIWPANREDVLDEDVQDLLDLTILHDSTIQRSLYIRYMKDMVYTNIGAIVVALNPWNFKIPWYVDSNMPAYLAEADVIKQNVPHSWAQAHNTFYDMKREGANQTILISGESGAGKTEAAKIVMKYLGAVSCLQGAQELKDAAKKVAFNINQASPILEGFGNAKTVRNDNSSRFGKFMKVQFNEEGFLVGAYTIKYLLEKSRIVTANPNERVYHSFYLLLKGKDAGKYSLKSADNYHVNAGGCIDIPGVDDGDDFSICLDAMSNCGFSNEDRDGVWSAVGGMLHLLQANFEKIDEDSCKEAASAGPLIDLTTSLWKIDKAILKKELVTTTFETRDGPVVKTHTVAKANDARDSLVKATYDQLFAWQVTKINGITDSGTGKNFIGLLDIFGFEDFEYNSFEQLCINLANETLQNHYNTFIFTKDMDECRAEGVDVKEVKCPDNMPCLLMMTAKSGIFSMLDDECSLGQAGTNEGFLGKVIDTHSSNTFFAQKKLAKDSFIIHHYAASVNYTVENWLEKNRDTLKPDMKLLMRSSGVPLISILIDEPDENAKNITTGGFFKQQLVELMNLINSTDPHWIRCVKPHPAKKPLMVHGIQTMTQLESSGVLGTVKIRKAGFPVRPTYPKFIARFKCILGDAPSAEADLKTLQDYCRKLIEKAGVEPKKAQCGKTKMFLKNEANQQLEAVREKALSIHVKRLVAAGLSVVSQKERRRRAWIQGAILIQSELRDWLSRSVAERQEREAQRAALLEQMKTLLEPFEASLKEATDAILQEEDEEYRTLMQAHHEGVGGMLAEIMGVVTRAEEEARFMLNIEEEDAWDALENSLAQQKVDLMFAEIDDLEARLRREIEEEWWYGQSKTPKWGLAEDVTDEVLGGPPTICTRSGLSGALEEFFSKEATVLEENICEWSEPYNRNVILKEELRKRQAFNRLFVIDYTEARLKEEELFEFIWRESNKDTEDKQFSALLQTFYAETLHRIEEPVSLKGVCTEPACRKMIEKERRDNVRTNHRLWRLLGVQGAEEAARMHLDEQYQLECKENDRRSVLEIQETEMRNECLAAIAPVMKIIDDAKEARAQRIKRRNAKIHALHQVWKAEADRIEANRFGAGASADSVLADMAEHQQQLRNTLQRYSDVAAPLTTDGADLSAHSPAAHLTRNRRRVADFEEYMHRVEAGEDVELVPNEDTDRTRLWEALVHAGEELSPLRGIDRDTVYPYNTLEHPYPRGSPGVQRYSPASSPMRLAPPPPLPEVGVGGGGLVGGYDGGGGGGGYDPEMPVMDQVRRYVGDVQAAEADAQSFLRAMRHAEGRVALNHVAAGHVPGSPRQLDTPLANYDSYGLRPEVLSRLNDARILDGNTDRLSQYHGGR